MASRPLSLGWCLALTALISGLTACGGGSNPPTPPTLEVPDAARSKVEVSRTTGVLANGQDAVTITVTVAKADGAALAGRTVRLTVTGQGNTVTPASGQTNPDGVMTASLVSTSAGSKQVTASVDADGGPVTLASRPTVEFVEPPATGPTKLAFTTQPVDGSAGEALPEVRVALQDAAGNTVTSASAAVTLNLLDGPAFTPVTVNAVDGVATFSGIRIDTAGTGYRFEATSGQLPAAQSDSFTISPAAATRLVFSTQPANGNVRVALATVAVTIQDEFGNTATAASPPVTVSLTGGNAAATLSGTLSATPSGGVATFADLSIDQEGTGFQLVASVGSLTGATSSAFTITDNIAPAAAVISAAQASSSSVRVTWTAVGDDGNLGTATSYDLRYAATAITNEAEFAAATAFSIPSPQAAGTPEAATVTGLNLGADIYFALKVIDGAGNSSLSNSARVGADPCAGVVCTPPAATCSANGREVIAYTSACVVSGGVGVCQDTPANSTCASYETCSSAACVPVTAGSQPGSIVISEFSSLGSEFIELRNTTGADIDVRGYTLRNAAGQEVDIRAPNDPNGTGSTPAMVPANGVLYGIANPSGSVPAGVGFIYGAPGTDFALSDTGDALAVYAAAPAGNLQDAVDFRSFVSNPDTSLTASHFVGFPGSSTQLDASVLTAAGNDTATNWCVSFYPGAARGSRVTNTQGAANGSCGVAVINEVLIDGPGGDSGEEFIEIAGPGGAVIGGARITDVEGRNPSAGTPNTLGTFTLPAGTRIPADGILVIVDLNPDGRTTNIPNYTFRPGVDIGLTTLVFEDGGGDAYQLINAAGTALLDAVGQDPTGPNLDTNTATANGLAMYETAVALTPPAPSSNWAVSLARSPASTDTDNNRNDFHVDPSPTPGAPNDAVSFTVTAITPDDTPAAASQATSITVTGTDFSPGMAVRTASAGVATNCSTVVSSTQATCSVLPGTGTVGRINLTFVNPASVGVPDVVLPNVFTYTGTENETDAALEADLCNLQSPASFPVARNTQVPSILGRIFEAGVTEPGGAPGGILAEVGFGSYTGNPLGPSDPRTHHTWRFFPANFNAQVDTSDEFIGSFIAPPIAATYAYTFRFSQDGGLRWTYCDLDGAGSNTDQIFDFTRLGVMTVN